MKVIFLRERGRECEREREKGEKGVREIERERKVEKRINSWSERLNL